MNRCIICLTILCFGLTSFGALNTPRGDIKTFDLTPSAPSTEYWLLCNPNQRLPGNAAFLYADAAALLNDKIVTDVDDAIHAYGSSDWNRFNSLSAQLDQDKLGMIDAGSNAHFHALFDLLDVAARREYYDWSCSFQQQGYFTLLPHLNGDRYLGSLIELHALQQIHAGKFDDTVNTLRLGFELGQKIGQEQFIVSGLVGVGIIAQTSDATAELMQQPQSPNLYWALAALPRPMISLQRAFARGPLWFQATFPQLAPDRLKDLSADDWRKILQQSATIVQKSNASIANIASNEQKLSDGVTRALPEARAYYARTYNLSADQVAALDPLKVVATYWYDQGQTQAEQQYRLASQSFPYPILIKEAEEFDHQLDQMKKEQPANVFLFWIPSLTPPAKTWARLDRTLDALTDVEAIRSYAAANDGQLPPSLDQITSAPAPDNPRTAKPFHYSVQDNTATLSDLETPEFPLNYTIRIRK
jgi:hypothetical protein